MAVSTAIGSFVHERVDIYECDNVFCSNCYVTTIVDYTMSDEKHGIVIKGKCKKCGKAVARVVEN